MNALFADAQFWIARFHPGDQWHERARELETQIEQRSLLTSEAVLVEFLNFFSAFRPAIRREAAHVAAEIHEGSSIEVWRRVLDYADRIHEAANKLPKHERYNLAEWDGGRQTADGGLQNASLREYR